jgi:O-antigen ligase
VTATRRTGLLPRAGDRAAAARLAALGFMGLVLVLGAAGLVGHSVFSQYSTLKYGLVVAGAVVVALLLVTPRPAAIAVALVVVAAPFTPFVMTLHGQKLSILLLCCVVAVPVVMLEGRVAAASRRSALGRSLPWIAVLLAIPAVDGGALGETWVTVLTVAVIAWLCGRVATLYPDGRDLIVLSLLACAGLQGLLAVVQYATGHATNLYGQGVATYSASYFFNYGTTVRTTGAFFDPISLGNVMALALPFGFLLAVRRDISPARRAIATVAALVITGGLVVSLSRAGWIAATAGVVLVALTSRGEQRRRAVTVAVAALAATAAVGLTLYGSVLTERVTSIVHPTSSSVRTANGDKLRLTEWRTALRIFFAHPLVGVGLRHLDTVLDQEIPGAGPQGNAQNLYLEYLGGGGIIGGAALATFLGAAARDIAAHWRSDPLGPALVGAGVAVLIEWVTDVTVFYTGVAACVAVLVGLIASSVCHEDADADAVDATRRPLPVA